MLYYQVLISVTIIVGKFQIVSPKSDSANDIEALVSRIECLAVKKNPLEADKNDEIHHVEAEQNDEIFCKENKELCRELLKKTVSKYQNCFIDNSPDSNKSLPFTQFNVHNCSWYKEKWNNFSSNPRQTVNELMFDAWRLIYRDDEGFVSLFTDEKPSFSNCSRNIRSLNRNLKWCWFLLTITRCSPPPTHPGLHLWYDIATELESTGKLEVFNLAQLLVAQVKDLRDKSNRGKKMPTSESELEKNLHLIPKCIKCAVPEGNFTTHSPRLSSFQP